MEQSLGPRQLPYRMLTIADGGSLAALQKKGNLAHVETTYNPGNAFAEVRIVVFRREDVAVRLQNPTLRVDYLRHLPGGTAALAFSFPLLLAQTVALIRRHRISVVRARNAYLAGALGTMAGRITGVPVVVSLGGDNRLAQRLLGRYYGGSPAISFRLEEFSLRRADRVFCVNDFTRRYAIRLGTRPERTRLVPHRVDVPMFAAPVDSAAARETLGLSDRPVVLFVGRLERDKQVDVLVEALPLILREQPNTSFVFLGDGSLRPDLEARCRQLGVEKAAHFPGFQPKERVARYMAAASVVWIPMSGFVIYEAAAAAKPILAYDVEWHSEFIESGKTGILVKDRDVPQTAEAVLVLLQDPERAQQLGLNARTKLQAEYDPRLIAGQEIDAYQELLDSRVVLP
jgi:glycosyltransferase involved in cell wall biosynthesis